MDYIHIENMQFYSYHGALEEENRLGQRFNVDVSLAVPLQEAGETDDLTKTINYAEVYEATKEVVEGEPVKLIETVAERIATSILTKFSPSIEGVRVKVIKPDPPIPGHYNHVAVEIVRGDYR